MIRICIRGYAAVFLVDEQVVDPNVLRTLGSVKYDDERFTDYLGGPQEEDALAAVLEPGGIIEFSYCEGDDLLTATTEYQSRRTLTNEELKCLADYTMGQWSDGIGENWACESPDRCGYQIVCLTQTDAMDKDYPAVLVNEEG